MASELPVIDAGFKYIVSAVSQSVSLAAFFGVFSLTGSNARIYVGGLLFNNFLESNNIWGKVGVERVFRAIAGGDDRKLPYVALVAQALMVRTRYESECSE